MSSNIWEYGYAFSQNVDHWQGPEVLDQVVELNTPSDIAEAHFCVLFCLLLYTKSARTLGARIELADVV